MSTQINSAHYAQNQNSTGLKFVLAMIAGVFLFYAVQQHWITSAFVAFLSLFFDHFATHAVSYISDIALLILFALALCGIYFLMRFYLPILIVACVLVILGNVFLADEKADLKPVKISSHKKYEQIGG